MNAPNFLTFAQLRAVFIIYGTDSYFQLLSICFPVFGQTLNRGFYAFCYGRSQHQMYFVTIIIKKQIKIDTIFTKP